MNISRPFNYKEVLINFKINKKYTNQYLKKYISFSKEINFGFKPLINFLDTDK